MNRNQGMALAIAAANLLLILLFPPFDQYSIAASRLPVFAGFDFYFSKPQYSEVNRSLLLLEVFVVLINAGIGWLLLRHDAPDAPRHRRNVRNVILIAIGVNLVIVLLFPPFESVFALTNAALPSFDGFYFIFVRPLNHVIVSTLLYLEAAFILVNGALLWMMFRPHVAAQFTPEQAYALAQQLRAKNPR